MQFYRIVNKDLFPTHFLGYKDVDDFFSYDGVLQEDGTKRFYHNFDELINHIMTRRSMVESQREQLETEVQHYLYLMREADPSLFTPNRTLKRTFLSDMRKGVQMAVSLSQVAYSGVKTPVDGGWITRAEAEDRGKACINCPHNNMKLKGSAIQELSDQAALGFRGKRWTQYDDKLGKCDRCKCPLKLKVHLAPDVIRTVNSVGDNVAVASDFPKTFKGKDGAEHTCWMPEILEE